MAKIGIIGYGIVGQAVKHGFEQKNNSHSFFIYDKYKNMQSLKEVVNNSEIIFLCLPTPSNEHGIDLSALDEMIKEINEISGGEKIIVIKSTVIPGTNKRYSMLCPKLKFVSNPEFLREAEYLNDAVNQDRIVIGFDDKGAGKKVEELYKNYFPDAKIFLCKSIEAEIVKYSGNCFLASKVIFANEINELCEKLGADYDAVKEIFSSDKRIGNSHLNVTEEKGFGGKCFPKDIMALIGVYDSLGINAEFLKAVWRKNLQIRKTRDWEKIPGAVSCNEKIIPRDN